jgi:hypothetical protein
MSLGQAFSARNLLLGTIESRCKRRGGERMVIVVDVEGIIRWLLGSAEAGRKGKGRTG